MTPPSTEVLRDAIGCRTPAGRHVIIEGITNADALARWETFASAFTQPHRETMPNISTCSCIT